MSNKPGSQPVTLRDVAAAAGVSVSTASRALTDGRYVSADKLERIREAAESIGYQPNEGARNLRSSRTMTIGLVSHDLRSPALLDLIRGMTEAVEGTGYSVFIANAAGRVTNYRTLVRRLFERRADALLLINPDGVSKEVEAFSESGRPVLAALSLGADCAHLPFVYSDESSAMRDAMRRLAALGHRSLAYLVHPSELQSTRPSFTAEIAREFNVVSSLIPFKSGGPPAETTDLLKRVLSSEAHPTALLLAHGGLGQLLGAIRGLKMEIPRDLSIVTFSDSTHTEGLIVPAIATIHTDLQKMGQEIIGMLLAALAGAELPARADVALSSWVEAESVGPAPITETPIA